MNDILWTGLLILLGLATMRFRGAILAALKRFDDENVRRIARQEDDRHDPHAHFRHTLEMADEQVEPVQEIAVGQGRHYLFEAQVFSSRDEAEEARARRVGVIARRFYEELPAAMAGSERRAPLSARERAARKWRRPGDTLH